ncbi:hypothetical protein [Desulfosporosinus acididurans]|uniref:hypothetical protein n=1 Tax=Desulfosporosinus acididurans TaxID=476652 RepID=UPI000A525385|nr:hypothetical protein [Desulfosporosinus acididurans]
MIKRISEGKLAGNRMKIFECQSEIHGQMRVFELKYELKVSGFCGRFEFLSKLYVSR